MQCSSCAVKRCSSEFPASALSEKCEHPPSFCLSCLSGGAAGLPEKCPEPGCRMILTEIDLQRLKAAIQHCDRECAAFKDLDTLKEREAQEKVDASLHTGPESGEVEVTVLDGRRCKLTINRQMHLSDVKKLIEQKLRVPSGQQRLLFRKRDLGTVENPDPRWGTLGVPFGEALQLIVIMYETGPASSSAVRSLTFDLSWTAMPITLRNGKVTTHHLNGSCLIFTAAGGHVGTVDFQGRRPVLGISHGGHSSLRSPKQTLQVETRLLPPDVKYLFFTLSAFAPGGVTMAVFQNPSVHLRDAATRTTLSSYTANQRNSEAVVLCYASKDLYGQWRVSQVGVSSSGNKSDYSPLVQTIQDLVHSGRAV
eukprot:symbB.v1.2.020056.t1/scaffold1666.1/size183716/2